MEHVVLLDLETWNFIFFFFKGMVFLCGSGWSQIHSHGLAYYDQQEYLSKIEMEMEIEQDCSGSEHLEECSRR